MLFSSTATACSSIPRSSPRRSMPSSRRVGFPITPEEVTLRFAGLTARDIGGVVEAELGRTLPAISSRSSKVEIDRRLASQSGGAGDPRVLDRLDGPRCVGSNSSGERLRITLERTRLYRPLRASHLLRRRGRRRQPKPAPNVYSCAFGAVRRSAPRETIVIEDLGLRRSAARAPAGARWSASPAAATPGRATPSSSPRPARRRSSAASPTCRRWPRPSWPGTGLPTSLLLLRHVSAGGRAPCLQHFLRSLA